MTAPRSGAAVELDGKAAVAAIAGQAFAARDASADDATRYRGLVRTLEEFGITCRESDRLQHLRAYLMVGPSRKTATVSTKLDYGETVFVLVHMLAHILLDHGRGKLWYVIIEQWEGTSSTPSLEDARLEKDANDLGRRIMKGDFSPEEWTDRPGGQGAWIERLATPLQEALRIALQPPDAQKPKSRRPSLGVGWDDFARPRSGNFYGPLSRPRLVGAGDRAFQDFAERYRQYFPRVFAYIYGRVRNVQAVEDLVSETFERAFVKAHAIRGEETFGTWLFTIARNVVMSYCRRENRFGIQVDYDWVNSLSSDSALEDDIPEREEVAKIERHVRRLPQREQDILSLKFDAELTNAQIGEVMGLTESNVRVIFTRTLQKLRKDIMGEA